MTIAPFGAGALAALAEAVDRAKCSDPLAPVAIVVPTDRMAVAARRGLARAGIAGRSGIAGITVVSLRRLAESVASATLAAGGRLPVTDPVLLAALDRRLAVEPGAFVEVADHPETARALAAAHRSLRGLPVAVVEAIAGCSALTADVVRMHRDTTHVLASDYFDEADLLAVATARVTDSAGALPPVVLYLPDDLDPQQARFVAALAQATDVVVILGATGDPALDQETWESWRSVLPPTEGAGDAMVAPAGVHTGPPVADAVIAATDPDAEVRAVVRHLVDRLGTGTPGHRMAILYGSRDPYARLLAEHLAAAGVTFNGRGVRPATERILGRAIRRVLALPDADFRRDAVLAVLSDAPVRWEGERVPSTSWERLSRQAGVVGGATWAERLAAYAERERAAAQRAREAVAKDDDVDVGARDEARAQQAERLAAFVADLMERLTSLAAAGTWAEAAGILAGLWDDVLGGEELRLPDDERRVAEVVERTIRSMSGLDALDAPVSLTAVRELLELELSADLDRVGRAGVGVHVGPVADGVGQHLDAVYVVGLAEGLFPARPAEDPLLPDAARHLTAGALPTLRQRIDRQHRQFLAALASAPPGSPESPNRVLSFPRGDLRRGGVRVPSRWLVPTLQALANDPQLVAIRWESLIGSTPGLFVEASYTAGVTSSRHPATDQEWRQRAHAAEAASGGDPVAARGLATRSARRGRSWTRHDGLVGPHPTLDRATCGVLSPTALEAWYACPHRFLVQHVLGVRELDAPEEIVEISALDSGSVMHKVLDRFVSEALAAGAQPRAGAPWPAGDKARLDRIIGEEFAAAKASGRAGLTGLWETAARRMRADLLDLLEQDDRRRAGSALTPAAAELAFGQHGVDPVEVDLGDGRRILIRGSIDRVDERADGSLAVVDYKTGKASKYKAISAEDPTGSGRFLQLPLYAAAARAGLGRPDVGAEVAYWFITRRAKYELIGYPVDPGVLAAATDVLRVAVDGISRGLFPPRPKDHSDAYHCAYCDPDGLGERTSAEQFDALLDHAPELADYRSVLRGTRGRVEQEREGDA